MRIKEEVISHLKQIERRRINSYNALFNVNLEKAYNYLLQAEDIRYCINIIKEIK